MMKSGIDVGRLLIRIVAFFFFQRVEHAFMVIGLPLPHSGSSE